MNTQKISIEYCHLDPAIDVSDQVKAANKYTSRFLRIYKREDVQMCMMIDDLHAQTSLDNKKIQQIVIALEVKPDCMYLESSFILLASALVDRLDNSRITLRNNGERKWLRTVREGYGSISEFLVAWHKKNEAVSFACPTLVAASYLYRLGVVRDKDILPIFGKKIMTGTMIVNMLEAKYMQVEENARELMKTAYPEVSMNVQWHFY